MFFYFLLCFNAERFMQAYLLCKPHTYYMFSIQDTIKKNFFLSKQVFSSLNGSLELLRHENQLLSIQSTFAL